MLGVGGAEQMGAGVDVDGQTVVDGVGHLAGQEAAPDQLVEPVLLLRQALAHQLRGQFHVGGADGLVGILCVGLGLKAAGLGRIIVCAVAGHDELLWPRPVRPRKDAGSQYAYR